MQTIAHPAIFQEQTSAGDSAINLKQAEFISVATGLFISGLLLLLGARTYAVGFIMVWLTGFCLINAIRSPEAALCIFAFLVPYEQLFYRYGLARYNMLSYLALFILFLWMIIFKIPRFFRKLAIEEFILLLFVVWALISNLSSTTLKGAIEAPVTVLGGVACFLLFRRALLDQLWLRRAIWFYVMGTLVLGTFSLVDYDTAANIQRGTEDNFDWVPSTLGWANGITSVLLARATSVGVVSAIFIGENEKDKKRKLIAYLAALVLSVFTMLTANRSANYGLLATLLIYILLGGKISTKARKVITVVLLGCLTVFIGFAINSGALETRLIDTTFGINISADTADDPNKAVNDVFSGRVEIWEEGIKIFQENPWMGTGLGQFQYEFQRATGETRGAHNTYLEVLVETGIIGLSIFILFFVSLFIKSWQCGKWRATSISWFILIVLAMGVQSLDRGKEYWIVMGITCAMVQLRRTSIKQLPDSISFRDKRFQPRRRAVLLDER